MKPSAISSAARAAVPLAWIALVSPALRWLWRSLPSEEYSSSLVLLIAAGAFLAVRAARGWQSGRWRFSGAPGIAPGPAAVLVASSAAYAAAQAALGIDLLCAALVGLGAYGLLGLYVPKDAWRRALPGALLLVAALPFGFYAGAYLGFPARLATAELVQSLLRHLGIQVASAQTVLVLENAAMNVDAPCSGIRSLWTGLVFFLAATCAERPRLGVRWIAAGAAYAALLFAANVGRVASLVLISQVAGQRELARIAHEPLGVAGFALASGAAYLLLRRLARAGAPAESIPEPAAASPARGWFALAGILAVLALVRGGAEAPAAPATAALSLPRELTAAPLPLSPAEADLFARHGGAAEKVSFEWHGRRGSLLVVHASSWRAHHPPEQCLRGEGLSIDSDLPVSFPGGLAARLLRVGGGRATAAYWFQSPSGTVDDLAARILAAARGTERRWALVTLVLDDSSVDAPSLGPLLLAVRGAVAQTFAGGRQ